MLKDIEKQQNLFPVCLSLAAEGSAPEPHVITPAYYCKSIEFISSTICILFPLKKEQNYYSKCSAFASSAAFALIFSFQTQ